MTTSRSATETPPLRHGPAAIPVVDAAALRPFHGIVSRGLLESLPADDPSGWERWSPMLDAAIADDGAAVDSVPRDLVSAARRCGVLTFAQSAAVARRFAEEELGEVFDGAASIDLEYLKEGHTASVWRLEGRGADGRPLRLALNVARDEPASEELERSAGSLAEIAGASEAVSVAEIVARARVLSPGPHAASPAVVAQDWIEDAAELAFLRARGGGRRLYAVERWITSTEVPGRISGAAGSNLDDDEHVEVARRGAHFLLDTVRVDDAGGLRFPRVDVNHGDWMWGDGSMYAVATAADTDIVPRAEARAYLHRVWTRGCADAGDAVEALLERGAELAWREACAGDHRGAGLVGDGGA